MTEITFYRQKRRDGSIRSGLHCSGPFDLESFEPGPADIADDPYAPVLDWIIDLQLDVPEEPIDAESGRRILLACSEPISSQLNQKIADLGVGFDTSLPVTLTDFDQLPVGYQCRLNCSISNRFKGAAFIAILRDFASSWPEYCQKLQVMVHQ